MNANIAYTAHSTPKKILSNFDLEKLVDECVSKQLQNKINVVYLSHSETLNIS